MRALRAIRTITLGAGLVASCARAPESLPVRGYSPDALDTLNAHEAVLRATPDSANIREYVRIMSEEPHHAGSPGDSAVAQWALAKFREWGLQAEIEQYEALLPVPILASVELTAPGYFKATMQEPVIPEDKDSGDRNQLPVSNAYSADGDVQGELVFANYGLAEDYALLDSLKIDLRGKIVMVKYARGVRSSKIKQAVARGAVGCIIYSDPEEDGFVRGDAYPKGPWRPEDAVQRGTALDYAAMYAGDPLSPGWASKPGARKLTRAQAKSLPTIPVVPLSYGDARPLLAALGGVEAPDDNWKGGLPITYHLGPGPARVRLRSKSEWNVRPLYNVVARIPGSTDPDQWVILANHHDGWVNGARDPVSAAAALMETARSLSVLMKTGWRPRRTLIVALWDGEEWGLLGSTEWAEDHADELRDKGVVYFNTDMYERGVFSAEGSHTLETFVREMARDLKDPETGLSAIDAARQRALARARTAPDSATIKADGFQLGAAGSGTDFEAFLEHVGIASVSHGFASGVGAGVYHSIYDSYDHFSKFVDPGFSYGMAQAAAVGTLALRMADAPIVPFSFSDAATAYRRFATGIVVQADAALGAERLDMGPVLQAIDRLATAGAAYDSAYAGVMHKGSAFVSSASEALRAINKDLYQSERDLLDPDGLPGREWFKSTMYATGIYTGFEGDPMPGVQQMIDARDLRASQAQVRKVAAAIERMAARAERVTVSMSTVLR